MTLSVAECTAYIAQYSKVFADATRDNLGARVEHCPEWSVADLVWHLTEVHWFWGKVAEERLAEPPDESLRPPRAEDPELVAAFESGAHHMIDVLDSADQSASGWTWFPGQQDVAFITRHQVQEAAVHAWDAVHAAGGSLAIHPRAAADSVDEFLTTSLADEEDAQRETFPTLDGSFVLIATDTGDSWTVHDGGVPGSRAMTRGAEQGVPVLSASASDLILWLYRRVELDPGEVSPDLLDRFHGGTGTD